MNKKVKILLISIVILVIGISGYYIYSKIKEKSLNYEIDKVEVVNFYKVNENKKYGVIDSKGKIVVEIKYEDIKIPNPEKPIFVCYDGGYTVVLNDRNQELYTKYEKVEAIQLQNIASEFMYEKSVLRYKENDKFGIMDFSGKKLTRAIYDEIKGLPYKEGELLVAKDGVFGVINIKGNEIVQCKYQEIETDGKYSEQDGYRYAGYIASIRTDEGYRYGYINYKGKKIIDMKYNELSRVVEKQSDNDIYIIAALNGQYGVLKNNKTILNNEYQSVKYNFSQDVFIVEKSKTYGVVNSSGQIIIPIEYNNIEVNGIYIYCETSQGVTVYDNKGSQVNIDPNIKILNTKNSEYQIKSQKDGEDIKYGILGSQGNELIEPKYNYIEYLQGDYFILSNNDKKLGVIDSKDKEIVKIKYNSIRKISNTDLIQCTTDDNTIDLYDKNFDMIASVQNAIIENIFDYIKIYNQNEFKYFSKTGLEIKNTEIYSNNKLFSSVKDGKWGFVDKNGDVVVDHIYESVSEFNVDGFASVKKDGEWGAINDSGNITAEIKYEFSQIQIPNFIDKYYMVIYSSGEKYYKK